MAIIITPLAIQNQALEFRDSEVVSKVRPPFDNLKKKKHFYYFIYLEF